MWVLRSSKSQTYLRQRAWIKSFAVKRLVTKVVRNCGEKKEIVASVKKTLTVDLEREALLLSGRAALEDPEAAAAEAELYIRAVESTVG